MDEIAIGGSPARSRGLPKTIGLLNIVFGFVLLLCSAGCLRGAVGVMAGNPRLELDPDVTREAAREMRRTFVGELRDRESRASDAAERARLRAERERLEARPESVEGNVDFRRVNLGTRRLAGYLWADVVTAPVLNVLMFASGVGLVRLKRWGLRLGIWVAALKILRLAALGVYLAAFALPAINRGMDEFADTDFAEVTSAKMREEQRDKQGGAVPGVQPVALAPGEIVKLLKRAGYIGAVVYTCFALVYPTIALLVLTRPAAAAAIQAGVDDTGQDYA
jgi:hypothetical protein